MFDIPSVWHHSHSPITGSSNFRTQVHQPEILLNASNSAAMAKSQPLAPGVCVCELFSFITKGVMEGEKKGSSVHQSSPLHRRQSYLLSDVGAETLPHGSFHPIVYAIPCVWHIWYQKLHLLIWRQLPPTSSSRPRVQPAFEKACVHVVPVCVCVTPATKDFQ